MYLLFECGSGDGEALGDEGGNDPVVCTTELDIWLLGKLSLLETVCGDAEVIEGAIETKDILYIWFCRMYTKYTDIWYIENEITST